MSSDLPFPDIDVRKIKTDDWKPKHAPMDYPKSFIKWVDSINKGWRNKIRYKPFDLYCAQAEEWLKDGDDIPAVTTHCTSQISMGRSRKVMSLQV
jgi:hypothetical protein